MALGSIAFHERICLYCGLASIPSFKINIMIQEILTYITLGIAVAFLFKKFFFKKKKSDKNCGDDCNCH
jgi:hypothetical protein